VALVRGRRRSGHLWLSTTADRAEAADGPSGGWRPDEQALPSLNGSPHHVCSERLAKYRAARDRKYLRVQRTGAQRAGVPGWARRLGASVAHPRIDEDVVDTRVGGVIRLEDLEAKGDQPPPALLEPMLGLDP
jgi:hypothetical protein